MEDLNRVFDSYTNSAGTYYIDNIKVYNDDILEASAAIEVASKATENIDSIINIVKKLEDKGYVMWKLDENRKRTYIVLTNKAEKLGLEQKRKLIDTYEKITENNSVINRFRRKYA